MKRLLILLLIAAAAGGAWYYWKNRPPEPIVLTGIVTGDAVIVSSRIAGRLNQLTVKQGDHVTKGQLLATIEPRELEAEQAYYRYTEQGASAQVKEAEAALRYQQQQTRAQVSQAQAALATARAQQAQAAADLEQARLEFRRAGNLHEQGIIAPQVYDQARTAFESAEARLEAAAKQVEQAQAAVDLAKSNAEQTAVRESQLAANRQQLAAAAAQKERAGVVVGYTEIRSPSDGIVDVRVALPGEVVNPAQPIVTLINPNDLWVRADVPETYIDQIRLGDRLPVRLPSGAEREGTIFYRGVEAGFATQRDVSRTKRDIKTFEIRMRVDNSDGALSLGMTAYVTLPVGVVTAEPRQ